MEQRQSNSDKSEISNIHPKLYNQDHAVKFEPKGSIMHKTAEYQKSPKTLARMQIVMWKIQDLEKKAKGLQFSLRHFSYIKKTPYAPRIIRFSRVPRKEKTFHESIDNLNWQIELLQCELETLIKFGA